MDIEKHVEGLVQVRFVGGFLHGRKTYMANPEFRMLMESPSGESYCYRRRILEPLNVNQESLMVATYAPEGMTDHDFTFWVRDAARAGLFKE